MARKPRNFTPEFKARVVLDILVTGKSLGEASRELGIKDSTLSRWRAEFIKRAPQVFEPGAGNASADVWIADLERMIGQLTIELDMAKKASSLIHYPRRKSGGS